jgi:hypothetical protein
VAVSLLLLLPSAMGTIVMVPNYNQGCNLNPYGTLVQFPPIGGTANGLVGPVLAGGYLLPGVSGAQHATTTGGFTSSAIQTAEWFMVGPPAGAGVKTCWLGTGAAVSLTAQWQVTMNPYLGANCTAGASATASYDVFVVSNFHNASSPYYYYPGISPHQTVDAFAIGCGSVAYAPGNQAYTVSVTTPTGAVTAGKYWDFYSAIWVSTQVQTGTTGAPTAFSGVTWEATLLKVTCTGC